MENVDRLKEAQYHVWFHHHDAKGWITLAKKRPDGSFKQYHYKPEELASKLAEWIGEDVYFSQNDFFKPMRRIETVKEIRSLYVDVDCHLLNYDPEWVVGKLKLEFFGIHIPEPNLIIFSGRGVVLIWLIDPVPYQALPLWQAVENYLVKQLEYVGSDAKAVDAARIFRIAGSTNSKNGEMVTVEYLHHHKYTLHDIQRDYLPELNEEIKKKKGRPARIVHLHNIYRLHCARLKDLTILVELRDYDVYGHREILLFLYRYWSCFAVADSHEALRHTLDFNAEFNHPLSEQEVIRATRSAEKAWEARNNKKANEIAIKHGYPGAGYNLRNSKLIEWLEITQEEQAYLTTIIDGVEKRRRKRKRDKQYQEQKRRERGDMTRQEYIKKMNSKTDTILFNLQKLLEKNPDFKKSKLAQTLGIHRSHLYRLLKQL